MAAQQRAGQRSRKALGDCCPGRIAVLADVIAGDLIRDTLVAEVQDQPIEKPRCVVPRDRGLDSLVP